MKESNGPIGAFPMTHRYIQESCENSTPHEHHKMILKCYENRNGTNFVFNYTEEIAIVNHVDEKQGAHKLFLPGLN